MCVHHITNEMVENKPTFKRGHDHQKLAGLLNDDKKILVAHNAKFDVTMLEKEGVHPKKIICSLKIAKYLEVKGKYPGTAFNI